MNTSYNLGLDLVRATEGAAIAAGRWMGRGDRIAADDAATSAMLGVLNELNMDGWIAVGEEAKSGFHSPLDSNKHIGNGRGPALDVVLDPIDGTNLLCEGRSGAISVAAVTPRGSMWHPPRSAYMEKLVVNREAAQALVPECLDAPAAWTLALIARVKQKKVRDLVVWILDRPRHADLIEEIRAAGARVALRAAGDVAGAILAATSDSDIDLLMGTGGTSEGLVAACAVRALGGGMLARLAPQNEQEWLELGKADPDLKQIRTVEQLVQGNEIYFVATGVSDGPLLDGVRYRSGWVETHSLVLRSETNTRRMIRAEHWLPEEQ